MSKPKSIITEYRNYYLPPNFPVLLLSGEHWKVSDAPNGRLHFHNCLEISMCHSNGGIMEFYGDPLTFHTGDVIVIPKNVPHALYNISATEGQWSYLYLNPQELFRSLLPGTWKNYDLSIYAFQDYKHILSKDQYPNIHFLVNQIIQEMEEQKTSYQISAKGLLLSLYIELYRIESADGLQYPDNNTNNSNPIPDNALVIAPALDYIEENYMQQFTIEYLADLCHWSTTHFRRVFHDIMGTSPLDFVNHTRIMKSCSLLRTTEASILDISEMVGFHSVSSYNRYFIKIMEMSPRDYRKQIQLSDKKIINPPIMEYPELLFPEKH